MNNQDSLITCSLRSREGDEVSRTPKFFSHPIFFLSVLVLLIMALHFGLIREDRREASREEEFKAKADYQARAPEVVKR